MFNGLVVDVPVRVIKQRIDGVFAVGFLRAVQGAARQQRGQLGDGDAPYLMVQDVVDTILQVRELRLQADQQTLGDLTEEHARLGERVEERDRTVRPDLLRQQVEHLVRKLRRGEHLIVGQVRQTRQHVRVVGLVAEIQSATHIWLPPENSSTGNS